MRPIADLIRVLVLAVAQTVVASGVHAEAPALGVAVFEAPEALRLSTNRVEKRLADLIGQQGARIRSLEGKGAPMALAAADLRRLALDAGVDGVLTGRAGGMANALDLDLELRSGHSGGLLGSWSLAASSEDLDGSLAAAAAGIANALGATVATDDAPTDELEDASRSRSESILGSTRGDGPIAIHSDQLDVVEVDGRRHLTFRDNVRVEQGDIRLRTRQLDAFYADGESQPQRLVATGAVYVVQGERVANCDRATYHRDDQLVVCSGRAKLTQGCDVVRGKRIEFDLEREHFRVTGAASVVLRRSDDSDCGKGGSS